MDFSVILFQSTVFDFCAIYFTTKTLLVHYCAPFIRGILNFPQVILITQSLCHTISPGVGVRVPQKYKDSGSLIASDRVSPHKALFYLMQ